MAIDAKNVINGTHGSVLLDGVELSEATAFQSRMEFTKTDVNILGSMATHSKITGWKGTGSVTMHKVDSKMGRLVAEQVRDGKTPTFTIIGALADPDAKGAERVAIYDVMFDDATIMDFTSGEIGSVECPFTFTNFEYLDYI